MTEDISGTIKLGVMMVLLSVLVTAAVNLTIIGNETLGSFVSRYVQAIHTSETSVVASLKNLDNIGAATAYKVIEERLGKVDKIKITYNDGTVTSDYKTLLKRADAIVTISVLITSVHTYNVEIKEVSS